MDRSEAIELSLRNRERALKKFDSERSARELIQVFEKTCIYHDFLGFAAMVGNQNIIEFVRGLGSPYVERGGSKLRFIDGLYRVALANKVVLTYLSRC